jgi:hypothetical protein
MSECFNEIIGLKEISLFKNEFVRLVYPDISNETEVNLEVNYSNTDSVQIEMREPKWQRIASYSRNYKQNYLDEFTFILYGLDSEIPDIIKAMRNNRLGFIIAIKTTGGNDYVFPAPVFLNTENTKQVDSYTWLISLSYKVPSFSDKLTLLDAIYNDELRIIDEEIEIVGVKKIALYINEDVRINRPNPNVENEVDLIAHAQGSFVIDEVKENPKWQRTVSYSDNFNQEYSDEFTFQLNGIENNVPEIIRSLRNNRLGYVVEIITTGNKSYVFPTPVFLNEENTKQIDSHSWNVSLGYRVPTSQDKLNKLNTILMIYSYVLGGGGDVVGGGVNDVLIG